MMSLKSFNFYQFMDCLKLFILGRLRHKVTIGLMLLFSTRFSHLWQKLSVDTEPKYFNKIFTPSAKIVGRYRTKNILTRFSHLRQKLSVDIEPKYFNMIFTPSAKIVSRYRTKIFSCIILYITG